MEELEKLYKKHKTWVDIVCTFGCNKETAEDIVMEMYIKIKNSIDKGLDIKYGKNDVNYYYIFRTLSGMFLDLKRKEKNTEFVELKELKKKTEQDEIINYEKYYEIIKEELDKLYWYDKKVYEIIEGGIKVSELSKKTNIGYYSLYGTYQKVLKHLKNKL